MIKYLILLLLPSLLLAQEIIYKDASREKSLVDSYLEAFTSNNSIGMYYDSKDLIDLLFNNYQSEVYRQTLRYLDQQTVSYPRATISLIDNIQAHWDSRYLQGYLLANAGDYGKLKFFSILGMVVGGIGLWKNPFAPFATLKSLNVLLPLAGGGAGYYTVRFFRKPATSPPEPQEFLRVADSNRQFSYAQKRNDYLYRLFSVGGGIASGDLIFRKIATAHQGGKATGSGISPVTGMADSTSSASDGLSKYRRTRSRPVVGEVGSLFKPQFKLSWWGPAIATLFALYAAQEGSYQLLRLAEIKKFEQQLKENIVALDHQVMIGDVDAVIDSSQQINDTVIKLVTLYEMEHLRIIADFETEFGKEASKFAQTDNDLRLKIEELLIKLTDKLPTKLTKALNRDNYRYADVGTLKYLSQLTYQTIIADQQLSQQPAVATIVRNFHEQQPERQTIQDLNENFSSYLELLLTEHYADAQTTITNGKLQKNIEILFQVATVFKQHSGNQQFAFLDHFQNKLEARFHNLSLSYENFAIILKRNAILRKKEFSYTDLQATIATYLDYQASDVSSGDSSPENSGSLTSTRSFARFLAEFIGKSDVKTYNILILELLTTYRQQPQQREAVAVLLNDIEELSELHDSYYDSLIMSSVEGGFVGAFALIGARALTKLVHIVGRDLGKTEPFRIVEKLLGARPWAQMATVFAIGATSGAGYHFIKKLTTKKIYPQQALFASQKLITYDLAQQTCTLKLAIEPIDQQNVANYNSQQIQKIRDNLARFADRVQQINKQIEHLNKHAPQLQINHQLQLPHNYQPNDNIAENCQNNTDNVTVSLSPLRQDLEHLNATLNQQKQTLDKIEKSRLENF